jgi:hypothetical protein
MATMLPLVVVYTVTGVDVEKMEEIRAEFSNEIRGREVRAHQRFVGVLCFSAIAPDPWTKFRWARLLRSLSGSLEPVTLTTQIGFNW